MQKDCGLTQRGSLQLADLDSCSAELGKLEEKSMQSQFWDDPPGAQEVMQRISNLKEQIAEAQQLERMLDDILTAIDLAKLEVHIQSRRRRRRFPFKATSCVHACLLPM